MRAVVSLAVLGLVWAAPAPAQESARAVLERAIVAHGGHEKLARNRAERVKLKGTLQAGAAAVPFTNELTVQLPGQYKSVVTIEKDQRTHTIVHLLDGEKAVILIDGQSQPVSGVHLAQLRQTLQLEQAMRLVPLLSDPGFAVLSLGEKRYNDLVYVGVRVSGKSQRDLVMYFDQRSGLLVKTEHALDGPAGKDVQQEAFYGDYRDVDGYRRPGKVIVFRDGKKVMEVELIEAVHCDRIDPEEFTRP